MRGRVQVSRAGAGVLALCACLLAQSQAPPTSEKSIEERDQKANGILVGSPKMYDDSLLQQMLSAAEARLSSLQAIDQASVLSRLGSVTGATQQISSLAVSAQGAPLPQIATTANGATKQVADTQKAAASDSFSVTTTTAPVTNVVTTAGQFGPPSVTTPDASTSLPSSFSVSASDVLNEQTQLTYEIANLRLLMEGSLSDWRVSDSKLLAPKSRTTIGFPITISADQRYKNAAAIVEVVVETEKSADLSRGQDPPAITALLPREKTYNVASITDRSFSLGGGIATQLVGISGSFLWGRKTYFIVKDQDTVARTFDPGNPKQTGFLWEFRPVLGRDFVQSGLKQTFVQLAFPTPERAGTVGKVKLRTYWRKVDKKTGVLKEVVLGSLRESDFAPVSIVDLKQDLAEVSVRSLEDLGNGQMLVTVPGRFLGGTYIRVGSNIYGPGSAGFTSEYRLLRFVAPISDLATKRVVLVSRDGNEMDIRIPGNAVSGSNTEVAVTPLDETNSLLAVNLKAAWDPLRPLVFVVGGKVFGYSDAPINRDGSTLSIALPTAFLIANPEIVVKPLLSDERNAIYITLFKPSTENERLVYITQDTDNTGLGSFLLFGRDLQNSTIVSPTGVTAQPVVTGGDFDTMQLIKIPLAALKQQKQLILKRPGERPFLVGIPALPSTSTSAPPDPKFQERVVVGADEATIVGDGLNSVDRVLFGKVELTIAEKSAKSIKLKGLAATGVTVAARTQDITLNSKGVNTKVTLEVVNQKIETVAK